MYLRTDALSDAHLLQCLQMEGLRPYSLKTCQILVLFSVHTPPTCTREYRHPHGPPKYAARYLSVADDRPQVESFPADFLPTAINRYPQHFLAFSWQYHQHTIVFSAARCRRLQQLQIVRLEAVKLRTPFTHNLIARSKLEYGLLSQPIFCSSHRKSCYQEGVQVS
jgi:hypothetical protein